jgi:Holliday junction resolvase RusA-like endonuclease
MILIFNVFGEPAPGGSKKGFFIKKIKRVVMAPASSKTKPWMSLVSAAAREAFQGELLTEPISLKLTFRFVRPKNHYGSGKNANILKESAPQHKTTKPDLTKLIRSTEDALTGFVWRDDSQIVKQETTKIYIDKNPGVLVQIETL